MSVSSSKSSSMVKSKTEADTSDTCSSASDEVDTDSFVLREVPHTETETLCKLCFRPAQPPGSSLRLGPLYEFGYCTAHLFCLMFSANLNQKGEDDEGINGFRVDDIVKEWRRGSQLKCIYCKKKYATLGCGSKACKKGYHLPCGLENGSLQQFTGKFESYCSVHKPLQLPFQKQKKSGGKLEMRDECGCCTFPLDDGETQDFLWTPCCSGWFHKDCIVQTAEKAGIHFFKCPLCNNKKDFTEEMLKFGVFVPEKDADWETGDAFSDQLHRHDSCDAETCLCPDGRKFDDEDTLWEIILCLLCGAQGIHVECGRLNKSRPRWKCSMCKPVVATMSKDPISVFTRVKRNKEPQNKEFTRGVFENLTFRVNTENYEINVDVHKNRKEPKDPVLVSFKVEGVPAFDIPKPVKVHRTEAESSIEKKKLKNIPCPFDDCDELLSRLEFKDHCLRHRKASVEENRRKESDKFPGNEIHENIETVTNEEMSSEEKKEEVFEETKGRHQDCDTPKRSSIKRLLSSFSPNSPDFEQPPSKKILLEKVKPSLLFSPTKTEEKGGVISSTLGYFRLDQDSQLQSPSRLVLSESHSQNN